MTTPTASPPEADPVPGPVPGPVPERADVVIVGAGFAGIGMAMELARTGRRDFVVLEHAERIGGTWRDNTYPGCACDTPSPIYAFGREPQPDWSRRFAAREEIGDYLDGLVHRHDLAGHLRTGTAMVSATFDEARGHWRVGWRRGTTLGTTVARILILGMGALHLPAKPRIRGIESFAGTAFHTARWDHSCELAGRRVALIGTGASAVQVAPWLAGRAAELRVYQRTAPWIIPRRDRVYSAWWRRLMRTVPGAARLRRWLCHWRREYLGLALFSSPARRVMVASARRHLRRQVADPELRALLNPSYAFGCKRVLLADDYYPALTRPEVEVVAAPIERVTPTGIRTADGVERPHDVIVFGTGFHVLDLYGFLKVTGRDGLRIGTRWRQGVSAYLGMMVSGFPNLFLLNGPNTGTGHHSAIFVMEAQERYIRRCLELMERTGAGTIEVRPRAQADYEDRLRRKHGGAVWETGGCDSWYLDRTGRNRALWPGLAWQYWWRARRPDPEAFTLDGLPVPPEPAPHEPAPHEPAPHEPAPHEPAPHEPAPHEPVRHEPVRHEPVPREPAPHAPVPHEPVPPEPVPHDPTPRGFDPT